MKKKKKKTPFSNPLSKTRPTQELCSDSAALRWLGSLDERAEQADSPSLARRLDAQRCALVRDCLQPTATWLRAAVAKAEAEAEAAAAAADDDDDGV